MKFMKKRISSLLVIGALAISQLCIFPFTANAATTATGHGLGCIPVAPSQVSSLPSLTAPVAPANLPASVDWTSQFPTPGDQGSQGSCTAWAVAYADKSMQEGLERGWPVNTTNHQYSPAYVYNQIDNGVDNGSSILVAMQLLVNQGDCTLQTMPYNQSDYTTQPTTAQTTSAALNKELSYTFVGYGSNTTAIKEQLATDNGVVLQIPVYSEFYYGTDGADYYNENGSLVGYHAICLIGYDDSMVMPDGTVGAFKFINSWGTGWGDGGYGYISYHVMGQDSYFQAYAMTDIVNTRISAMGFDFYSAAAVKPDGTVWTWGANQYGQLGNGTTTDSSVPVQVPGLSNVISVATGGYGDTVALKSDGTVWAWGYNYDGQLGNGTTTNSSVPLQVPGLSGVVAIASGDGHTVALKSDGTVWTWGNNTNGQIGNGTYVNQLTPYQVSGLTGVRTITAGCCDTAAIKSDGTVWAWGSNIDGQLGNGQGGVGVDNATPTQSANLTGAVSLSFGDGFLVTLKSDGTVWTCGWNWVGEVGNGTTTNQYTPYQVSGLGKIVSIAAGTTNAVAITSDGSVWTWGGNNCGQIGNGTYNSQLTPYKVSFVSNAVQASAGSYNTSVVKSDGTVWSWGYNCNGQLGNGTTKDATTAAVQTSGLNLN